MSSLIWDVPAVTLLLAPLRTTREANEPNPKPYLEDHGTW